MVFLTLVYGKGVKDKDMTNEITYTARVTEWREKRVKVYVWEIHL
jgi:hypothetical protein